MSQWFRVLSEVLGGRRTVGWAATLLDVTPPVPVGALTESQTEAAVGLSVDLGHSAQVGFP